MQYLWIGCMESDEEFVKKAQKGYTLASAQVSQCNLLNGIEDVTGKIFDSINAAVLPPFPVYADRIVEKVEWAHKPGARDVSVGFKNTKYVNRIYSKNAMLTEAKKWLRERYDGGEVTLFAYSMRSASMATACYIKRHVKKASIYLIVTDLPQFMDLGQSRLKAMLKKFDWLSIKRMQKCFDGFILYASQMADFLHIPDGKWMLMEGSYAEKKTSMAETSGKKKAVMYSGKLDVQYGIPMLIQAFMRMKDPEAELWLTGGGNAEEYIRECAAKDPRIRFYGFLPSRSDVLKLQQQASLLVNMRLPSEEASAYCFPSKLFEYMATAIPVLTLRLKGIPEEYYKFLVVAEEDVQSLSCAMQSALAIPDEEQKKLGTLAAEFVRKNKTPAAQAKRIMEYVTHE